MIVKLPRECSGLEILSAFKMASTSQETPEILWGPNEFAREFQYEPGSIRQTLRSMGVRASPSYFKRRWGLFGKKVWKQGSSKRFSLNPIVLHDRYDEVEVTIEDFDVLHGGWVTTDQRLSTFEQTRPQLEKTLKYFYARLQS